MRFNENEEFDVLGFLDESMHKVHINPNDQLYFFIELLSPFPKSVNALFLYFVISILFHFVFVILKFMKYVIYEHRIFFDSIEHKISMS